MSQSTPSGSNSAIQRGNPERLGIAGAGTIACGLAAAAAECGLQVTLWGRSDRSLARARDNLGEESPVALTRDLDGLSSATLAVEAVVEEPDAKEEVLSSVA